MIEAIGLAKHFGPVVALRGLDLRVESGEIFCLLGANGAGKTTTIHLLLGFLAPTAGTARIAGTDVSENPQKARSELAYVPENVMLYPNLSGLENLEFFMTLAGRAHLSKTALRTALQRAGLASSDADRRLGAYSRGMRQKVGIALAIAKGARALLLDEPTSGLDPKASIEFSRLLRELREEGVAVLMATHDIFRSKEVGDRVGIMRHGEMVATYSTADLGHTDLEKVYMEHMRD